MSTYSEREIELLFKGVHDKLDILITIGEETRAALSITEQRVGALERWQNRITGGLAIVTVLIIPMLFMVISTYIK